MLKILFKLAPAARCILVALAVPIAALSCELSSGFLSESERSSLYTITIDVADGSALKDGAVILPGTEFAAIVTKKAGAAELATLDFSLATKAGDIASGLRMLAADAKSPPSDSSKSVGPSASRSVHSIDGRLSGFLIPKGTASGLYVLSASIAGADGAVLQKYSVNIFIGDKRPLIESVSTFPPSVEPGASVLIGLTVSWLSIAAPDPAPIPPAEPAKPSPADASSKDIAPPGAAVEKGETVSLDETDALTAAVENPAGDEKAKEEPVPEIPPLADAVSPSIDAAIAGATMASPSITDSPIAAAPVETPSAAVAEAEAPFIPVIEAAPDPWIRWSRDGKSFGEGLLSDGLDKFVWSAPRIEGAYSVMVEVFPSAPPAGSTYSFGSPVSQELKIMVIAPPGGSGNDFADPLAFYSLLRLDGSFDDVGTRPRTAQPESFGAPALDTYSIGFGYRFGPTSGVVIPGLMPPASDGALGAFSAILRLDSDRGDGVLVSFASDDGGYALILGIKDFKPYVESTFEGKTQRATALSPVSRFPLTLEATLRPDGEKLSIVWRAEGERLDSPSLPLPPAPPEGSARIGGAQSLPGVYDGFGVMAGASTPAYRLASRRKWKGSLILAESFEDGALPPLSTATGEVAAAAGILRLEPGSAVSFEPSFGIASAVVVEADIDGDRDSCAIVLSSPSRARLLSISGTGEVRDPAGKAAGSVASANGRIAISIELKDGKAILRGADGSDPVILPCAAKRFALSLERQGGAEGAAVDRLLVRSSLASTARK